MSILEILQQPEGRRLEFKKTLPTVDGYYQEQTKEKLNMTTLRKLELIKSHQKQVLPTNAYFLFSNQDIKRKLFPYAKIECARFKGVKSEEFIDQKTYDGSIATQAELAYEFVLRQVNQGAVVEGVYYDSVSRQSDIRNKVIAPIFKKLGIIDQWGNGLKLIADEMKEYPEIEFK